MATQLSVLPSVTSDVAEDVSYIGSGSLPDEGIATRVVRVRPARQSPADFARRLRQAVPSVFARIADGALVLDLRTMRGDDVAQVIAAVGATARD
jgi:L-seryl-tRNA(Ser) seleniumtransferase